MGKLAIVSDLHTDINQFKTEQLQQLRTVLNAYDVTRLHIAGDSANKIKTALKVNDYFRTSGLDTTFNLGNHEMASIQGEQMIEHFPDSHFLNLRYLPLNSTTVLLGINGWYDYRFFPAEDAKKIAAMKNLYWYDRNIQRGADDLTINQMLLQAVKKVLDELAQKEYEVIIATHFVPQEAFIVNLQGKYAVWNKLNAFLGSKSLGELFNQYQNIKQVVFGHTHRRFSDQMIANTRYSCRPLGYFYEWQLTKDFVLDNQLVTDYNPMKLRPVIRNHRQAFDAYQEEHLIEEFSQALTLIPY